MAVNFAKLPELVRKAGRLARDRPKNSAAGRAISAP